MKLSESNTSALNTASAPAASPDRADVAHIPTVTDVADGVDGAQSTQATQATQATAIRPMRSPAPEEAAAAVSATKPRMYKDSPLGRLGH